MAKGKPRWDLVVLALGGIFLLMIPVLLFMGMSETGIAMIITAILGGGGIGGFIGIRSCNSPAK